MIRELKQRRAALIARLREIAESAESEDRDLSAEETQEYERVEQEFDGLTRRIARVESLGSEQDNPATQADEGREVDSQSETREITPASDEYRDAFEALTRSRGRVDHLQPEQRAALQVGTDAEGGYTVPDEFLRNLYVALREFGSIRALATVITTADSGDVALPATDTRATAAWTAEEAAYTESESTFKQMVLGSFKAGALSKVSDELLHDSAFDILGFLATDLGEAVALLEDAAFAVGASGSTTTPEGVVVKASAGITAAGAAAITSDELIDLYHSLLSPYRASATWLMKDSTVKLVRKLKDGNNQYFWQPGLVAGQPDTILSRPVVVNPNVPAATTGLRSVAFGDISRYYIRDVEGVTIKVLNELYAVNGQVGFRISRRTDGDLRDTAAVKVLTQV